MTENINAVVKDICQKYGNDRCRMMDVVRDVQDQFNHVPPTAFDAIAKELSVHRVEVEGMVSFYAFLSNQPKGQVVIRVCTDLIDKLKGVEQVLAAFEDELGIKAGESTADGKVSLEATPCIGMCDQAPAVLVNDTVVSCLTPEKAREVARMIKEKGAGAELVSTRGDGNNADDLIGAMVRNNIMKTGDVIFAPFESGAALRKTLAMTPEDVIGEIKTSRLRGRGGAGFPTGMKWEFTRNSKSDKRYILCNADEGEPGTFKDRVLLTECPDLLIEGMTIAGYAIGAQAGILYLRAEYAYLRKFLEDVLAKRRQAGLLGNKVCGNDTFDFDIRIQMGAGAYICGEETALISSCEGDRGDPKNRPPFPAQKGFLGLPTAVNNVETLCCAARIMDKGAAWFADIGSKGSPGTKVLSVSGDCEKPGVYEVPFGTSVQEILEMSGATDIQAVQVGGPSGKMIGKNDFAKKVCYDDLATGGSFMVFNSSRNIVEIAQEFMEFFVEESCGYCTPCRVGNVLLRRKLGEILSGHGESADLDYLVDLGKTVKFTSRCGLGQTSPNPVLSTIENFRQEYEKLMPEKKDPTFIASFDIAAALSDSKQLTGRESEIFK